MKKIPRKSKQWADEVLSALETATQFAQEDAGEDTRMDYEILKVAPAIAAMNRGVSTQKAMAVVYGRIEETLSQLNNPAADDEPIFFALAFAAYYLATNVELKAISISKAQDTLEFIYENVSV